MPFKVLLAHNYYLQPGGEDTAFAAEVRLLRSRGHEVVEYVDDNRRVASLGQARTALQAIWSGPGYARLEQVLRRERPDVAHFHNTFPLISPSAYYACRKAGIPVVQSLDNPRLLCPSANFYRDGRLCQDCLGKTPPWPSVVHRCYHRSAVQTAVVASMLTAHRVLRTWQRMVDLYLVATEFYRNKFIEGGLPASRLRVKPHFVDPDPGVGTTGRQGAYALFVGRLDPEKGVDTLLQAWRTIGDIPLKICGEGRLEAHVRDFIERNHLTNCVELVGRLPTDPFLEMMKGARFLVWPSEGYYETFGYVAVESFGCGVPVIAGRLGVPAEIVSHGSTGLLFDPGSPADLAQKVQWAWDHAGDMVRMGHQARAEYESKYTADRNYPLLLDAYETAIRHRWPSHFSEGPG
ncbi:MAG TPA: glycosyltransferase [Anaerolineales bacterium]